MIAELDNLILRFMGKEVNNLFFTSDTHWGHENILLPCGRPFKSIEEHDAALVENWNKKVPKNGVVFHLGDVAMKFEQDRLKEILDSLNGKIYLIIGNHDVQYLEFLKYRFEAMYWQLGLHIGQHSVLLNHNPFLCYAGAWKEKPKAIQLFGHVHSGQYNVTGIDLPRLQHLFPWQYDVGVDANNFMPISWNEIIEIMQKRREKKLEDLANESDLQTLHES